MKRRVTFYATNYFDCGAFDCPEGGDPTETKEGYYIDVIHEPYMDSDTSTMVIRSKILIELDDKNIISILPRQLIKFED